MGRHKINENGLLAIRGFAALAGCDEHAVERAIKMGYLGDGVSRNAQGHFRIDPEKARANWARNWADTATAPQALRDYLRGAAGTFHTELPPVRAKDVDWDNMPVSGSRQIREAAKARQEQLNLETRIGKLVPVEQVHAAQFEIGQIVRRGLESMLSRVAEEIGLTHDQTQRLKTEIGKSLVALADLEGVDFTVPLPT